MRASTWLALGVGVVVAGVAGAFLPLWAAVLAGIVATLVAAGLADQYRKARR